MNYLKYIYLICILSLLFITGCSEEMPLNTDGDTNLTLQVNWTFSDTLLPLSNAKVILSSEYGIMIRYTNENGTLVLNGLPSAKYNISVRKQHPQDKSITIVGSLLNVDLISGKKLQEIIIAKPVSGMGLSINEIYFAGPVNNQFYFYDQFIELYNSSDSIKYLDGIMILRVSSNSVSDGHKGPGADEDNDNDLDGVVYAFRFPGISGGKEYPLKAKEFITLACDAVDHRKISTKSIDLSNANWEFYNQFSPDDLNNPSVPNLRNMISEKTADFLISLTNDVILIATGTDSIYTDGIDVTSIIDGIEYQTSNTSRKTLDERVDRSFVLSPPKYSGRSVQRREPGVDTNNGMLDWEILLTPTPSYH